MSYRTVDEESPVNNTTLAEPALYVLRFPPLQPHGSSLGFPCNETGEVPLNSLSERVRNDYFLARHGVGRNFSRPCVEALLKAPMQALSQGVDHRHETYLVTRPRPTALV